MAAAPAVFRMNDRRDSAAGELQDWLCFMASGSVLRMFARNGLAEQFFFSQRKIDPFDGFVNAGCGPEAGHSIEPLSDPGDESVSFSSQ